MIKKCLLKFDSVLQIVQSQLRDIGEILVQNHVLLHVPTQINMVMFLIIVNAILVMRTVIRAQEQR